MRKSVSRCMVSLVVLLVLSLGAAFAAPPVIEDVQIDRGRDTGAPDWATYHQRVTVVVSDADGAADIASVTIGDPATASHELTPGGGGAWWEIDANTIGCEFNQESQLTPPAPGAYTIVAADATPTEVSLTTPAAPAVSDTHPQISAPAMESVIADTAPTFSWTAGLAGSSYHIDVEEEGTLGAIWSADVPGTSCGYNFDAGASRAALLPNHSYFWQVLSSRMEDDRVTDPLVAISTSQKTRGRFTVAGGWPGTPPALEGKFAYEVCLWASGWEWWGMSSVLGYNTSPSLRTWYGPDSAGYPDWSPDGSKLLYSAPGGIWIDSIDGSAPLQVPGVDGGDCRWASDSGRVLYATQGPPSPYTQHPPWNSDVWVSNIDGTHNYPLADSIYHDERWPDWSPDGLWVAYRKLPDSEGVGLWLIRYDRTDDHPLIATGVVGYSDYEVGYMGEHAWSSDGTELVVNFQAESLSDSIGGIGIIAKDGGPVTPVFLSPPGYTCCAGVHLPNWSPDGTRIVFSSAHHVADPVPDGDFEPRVELWLANVDGSGSPVRLTYDEAFSYYPAWWNMNTPPGETVQVTKGATTVTFDQVIDTGNTSVTVYEEPIDLPFNFEFCQDQYQITTTAQIAGPISICMSYDEADIPTGSSEADLCLLHYNEAGDYWEDITVSRDPSTNVVCGESTSLSVFTLSAAPATRFPDVPSHGAGEYGTDAHWAFYEVEACAQNGVVGGYGDGTYQPTWQVTRGQMAAFIARALVAPEGDAGLESWSAPATPTFPDVNLGFWAYKHIEYLKSLKIVGGYDDGLYRPSATVTRDQMAAYISRAIADPKGDEGLAGFSPPATPTFPDVPEEQWAYTYIEYAYANGVVQGYPYPDPQDPDATICRYLPNVIVTRCQMAVYVARAFALTP